MEDVEVGHGVGDDNFVHASDVSLRIILRTKHNSPTLMQESAGAEQ
jgi:hypothetical protein